MRVHLLALAILLCFAPTLSSAQDTDTPLEVVRSLKRLQDRIALGDAVAGATYAKAVSSTAHDFSARARSVWKDKRNARALVIYLLSGGSASAISESIAAADVNADFQTLYTGAIAYSTGDDSRARAQLMPIDAKSLPTSLGGHLALVQGTLSASEDRDKAIALLDLARLLEPGTLIEEAALRKELSLLGAGDNLDKLSFLCRRYVSAFPKSLYAYNFRQTIQEAAFRIAAENSDEAAKRLGKLMLALDTNTRRSLYLAVGRDAVLAGRTKIAAVASTEGGLLAQASESDKARSMVYFGAAAIVGNQYDQGRQALRAAKLERLDVRDRTLLGSAIALADMIRRPTLPGSTTTHEGIRAETLSAAESSIVQADALLNQPDK